MAIFKCKICGGTLEIDGAQSVATCEYCGTKQTLPRLDDDRKANLYDRANHFRRNNDFDKAMGIYEAILNEDSTDSEAYWSIVLCRYGIEYVEDPTTHKRVPTVNRAQYTSIFDDEDYKSAITNADEYQREIYESEANTINEIQKGFLAVSQKEEPFDVFICYKETDNNGRRTQDSVLATELYNELTREGFKVFFSRITLEDKLGIAYEPYIFAALNSAKVMVVLGTRPEHFNAVWVKNEWSRYLALIKNGAKKTLIPAYRDIDPYDLPEEFSHLQAQDMSRLGFMQDLIRGIKKIVELNEPKKTAIKETIVTGTNVGIEPLFKRASMALADREFGHADAFYEQILNQDPENAEAYVGKLLAELHVKKKSDLANSEVSFENSNHYKKAIKFANAELKNELSNALQTVLTRIDNKKKDEIYQRAKFLLNGARDIPTCKNAQKLFLSISGYLDAEQCIASCQEKIDAFQKEWEQLRLDQRKKAEERKIAIKKAKKKFLVISSCILLVAIFSVIAYVSISYVVIPNTQYKEALEMIEEQKYDDAIALLKTAKENALFDKTISKIDQAIDDAETEKERKKAAEEAQKLEEEAKKALEQAIANGMSDIANANYETAIRKLLQAGVITHIVYQCEGGNLIGSDSNEIIYTSESEFPGLLTPERTGYRFVGWTCEIYEHQKAEASFNLVFKASWSEKEYVIKYDLSGGTANNVTAYSVEDEDFTLNAPTRTGYTFIGWMGTDLPKATMNVTIPTGSHGDRFYTASWQANKYSVSFDLAYGNSALNDATYTYGSSFTLPTPQRDAYTFVGWYNGTQKIESGTWQTPNDVTLVAWWTPTVYSVTYDLGKVPASNTNRTWFTVESGTITLSNLSYDYCTFEGWYSDSNFTNKVTEIPKGTRENITLYAKWESQIFTIEYDWNGGDEVTSAQKTYTFFDLPLSLGTAQKSEHSFYYWALGELDGKPVKQITTCGNYKLVANYIPDGLEIRTLTGGDRANKWCDARYIGNATEIEIPKYHMQSDYYASPYINTISLVTAPNLENMSFSNEIIEIDITDNFQFNVYENGNYVGSRNNPYHSLVGRADPKVSITTIHQNTVYIGENVFRDDTTLVSIVVPEKIKYIDYNAFLGCYNLVEVYNLSSLNIKIGSHDHGGVAYYAVVLHTSLDKESVISYTVIDNFEFRYNKTTNEYTLIRYLGNEHSLSLPKNINGCNYKIGRGAFKGANILSIVIPPSVTEIEDDAFIDNRLLEIYDLSSLNIATSSAYEYIKIRLYAIVVHTSMDEPSIFIKQGDYYFYYIQERQTYGLAAYVGSDTEPVLPDDINGHTYFIATTAFLCNKNIVSVTIPKGVTKIAPRAFEGCDNLTDVFFEITTGWTREGNSFNGTIVYESTELSDSKNAAKILRFLTYTGEPMIRNEEA